VEAPFETTFFRDGGSGNDESLYLGATLKSRKRGFLKATDVPKEVSPT
jgi:hypothetical protein